MLQGADPLVAAQSLRPEDLDAANLRSPEVAQAASQVAVMAEVRAELLAFQQGFARREGGAVLDGRDIGTVICPKAEVKLFVTASAEVRARRRHQELVAGGTQIDFDQVLADVTTRDARDAERAEAPMIAAVDAVVIDTSNLTINGAIAVAVSIVQERIIS
jgi:cytidylate kinase